MNIQSRLNTGIIAIAVVLVAPLVMSLLSLQRLQTQTTELRDREYAATLLLGRMRSVHDELSQNTNVLTLVPSDTVAEILQERLTTMSRQADTLQRAVESGTISRIRSAVARLAEQAPRAYAMFRGGKTPAADSIVDLVMRPALSDIERVLQNTELALQERTAERVQDFADETAQIRLVAFGALGIAILLAFAIAHFLNRSISTPMQELDAGMRAVAEGQFARPIAIAAGRDDEFGRLAESFRSMARQLQELDRLKAEFVSIASHELKTPVNVMLGYLQLLQEGAYGDLTPRQREICDTLTSQTQLLSRLVRQLLDVSRFDAGGGKLDVRPFVLEDFLADLERAFRVLALQRDVAFEVRRDHDLPHEVSWDAERMNEVLGNLLSNAFKFTSRGGRVSLSVARDGDELRMQVRDTGAGIPAGQLPRIFEKFFQADSDTPTALRGAGLGLAIAKSIVTAHAGTIAVESRLGVGTTFTIRLPSRVVRRAPAAHADGAAPAASVPAAAGSGAAGATGAAA
jgi:signal transduction histidine kinase